MIDGRLVRLAGPRRRDPAWGGVVAPPEPRGGGEGPSRRSLAGDCGSRAKASQAASPAAAPKPRDLAFLRRQRSWDPQSIVPEDVVPHLADPQAQATHGAGDVDMAVVRHIRYDVARVLMTGCKEVGDDDGAAGGDDEAEAECSVCFDALRGDAVELPGCAHAFHHLCMISKWFCRKKSTCPLCRGDVAKYLDPELQKEIAELTDDAM